ncbi:chitin deacetylase [Diplodia corticola]|uniref:Chitin deacetylase n=1 Tax=Diplodia corticola TaxID=236234 RepID=A0A1J9QJL6_9PEZI|nr:chitin deacetylase [Diplodia corticola]OJD29062.1 chitin deacetylase [Diplodia corticola]
MATSHSNTSPPPTNTDDKNIRSSQSPGATTKAKEAASNIFLTTSRQSTDTVSTLPEYTEKSENSNRSGDPQGSARASADNTSAQKSKLGSAFDRVKAKVGRGEPDSPERAEEKARRREEYERRGLGDRTKYGVGGMGWSG